MIAGRDDAGRNQQTVIGIDLGTTHTVMAQVSASGLVHCLPNRDGDVLTPSVVAAADGGRMEVGQAARQRGLEHPNMAVDAFKRRMGDAAWSIRLGEQRLTAAQLSALLLRRMHEDAERIVGPIRGAVVTVPAYFGERERCATYEAATMAGLTVLEMINEPTAAALAAAFDAYLAAGGDGRQATSAAIATTAPAINVVFDLGGGTLDVTVIRIDGHRFDILASTGKPLGGRDFDDVIVDVLTRHLFEQNGPDPHYDLVAQAQMRAAAERAKHELTVKQSATIALPYDRIPRLTLSREAFERTSQPLLCRARELVEQVMADADLDWAQIEELQLVGGATRMPMIRGMLESISGLRANTRLQPDLIVAQGAAVYANILTRQNGVASSCQAINPASRSPAPTAQDDDDDLTLVDDSGADGSSSPAHGPRTKSTSNTEPAAPREAKVAKQGMADGQAESAERSPLADLLEQQAVNQAGDMMDMAFAAAASSVQVHDVTAQSVGVIVRSPRERRKVNKVIIHRNSRIPTSASEVFATRHDGQRRVCIPVVEGDSRDPRQCVEIGRCVIDPLPPDLPSGSRVKVTFVHDRSGCLQVRAEEQVFGSSAETTLHRGGEMAGSRLRDLADAVAQLSVS